MHPYGGQYSHFRRPPRAGTAVDGDADAPQRVFEGVRNLEGVASAGEPQFNDAETVAIVFVTPDSAPQDEATSVVFGMPREAIARGAVDEVVALPQIAARLVRAAEIQAAGARAPRG